ncbi:MAG: hydrogenase nickel incorporation protein HypB [Actinomycetota bacterium]|nr:hydrogenase nickel incorporation protein HypB [Actinomycetota bacterium]
MGRFHRHEDGTVHTHEHDHDGHVHDHDGHVHAHDQEHGDHSGYETGSERIAVLERIFSENDAAADANRARLHAAGIRTINLMSSPGSGKTTLLQRTLAHLQGHVRVGVVEGDIETSVDADRLAGLGAQVSLLNTANGFGGECHLDAPMVARALAGLDLETLDLVFVENVGNLVCPAEFDVGADFRVMICSVPEGEEKPLKYPVMFRSVDLVLINKIDLLPYLDYDIELFERNLAQVNPGVASLRISATTGEGLEAWHEWLETRLVTAAVAAAGPAAS